MLSFLNNALGAYQLKLDLHERGLLAHFLLFKFNYTIFAQEMPAAAYGFIQKNWHFF